MTRRRTILLTPAGLLIALALAVLTMSSDVVSAEGPSCSSGCKAAYGACYKKSQDRSKCQAQLQRCLETCIKSKR